MLLPLEPYVWKGCQNLDAHLEAQCQQAAFDSLTEQTEAPLSVAVGLIVRQRLTGRSLLRVRKI